MEKQLELYLYKQIPISKAMGIQVEHASPDRILLSAPLSNNINHKKTVFGGSLHAAATLACWSLLYVNLKEAKEGHVQIVITKSEILYQVPVEGDFKVECRMEDPSAWHRFLKTLHLKGKARITLSAKILQQGKLAVDFQGTFAAIKS